MSSFYLYASLQKMKTREEIIHSMCFTYRHDYGFIRNDDDTFAGSLISGMTEIERKSLYNTMAQIFDNDILPYMDFRK